MSTGGPVEAVTALSENPAVHGTLLQHPVGAHIDERTESGASAPEEDVDDVTTRSFAAPGFGLPGSVSCAPGGITRLLDEYDVGLTGKHAVVVGRGPIPGRPAGTLPLGRDATVTHCHSRAVGLSSIVREADIVVAAVGRPCFIGGADIEPGAVMIDAGYNSGHVGDVDFEGARRRADLITPVPGGVGPMTIAVLLARTVEAAERQLVLSRHRNPSAGTDAGSADGWIKGGPSRVRRGGR